MERRRIVGLLVLLLAVTGCKQGGATAEDPAIARGRAHVDKRCVGCHAGAKLDDVLERRLDPQDPAAFDAFLADHYVEDADLRADVVAYLLTRREHAPAGE